MEKFCLSFFFGVESQRLVRDLNKRGISVSLISLNGGNSVDIRTVMIQLVAQGSGYFAAERETPQSLWTMRHTGEATRGCVGPMHLVTNRLSCDASMHAVASACMHAGCRYTCIPLTACQSRLLPWAYTIIV